MREYPVCDHCGTELNPNLWDDSEKYFMVGREIYCKECFRDWLRDWIEGSLDEVAAVICVPVVEVFE